MHGVCVAHVYTCSAYVIVILYGQLCIGVFIARVPEGVKRPRGECNKEPMHSWSYNNLLVVGAYNLFFLLGCVRCFWLAAIYR